MPCQVTYKTGDKSSSGVDVGVDSLQPGLWVPAGAPACAQLAYTLAGTNIGIVTRFVCPRSIVVSKAAFLVATAASVNDSCDAGIFSGDGATLLGSSGSTAGKLNSAAIQTVNFQAPISLVAGQVYYAAFAWGAVGGTAAAVIATNFNTMMNPAFGSVPPLPEQGYKVGFPLAAPLTVSQPVNSGVIMALQI